MESKILKNIIRYLSISIIAVVFANSAKACCESEAYEVYRIAMFRCEMPKMLKLQEFYYTMDLFNCQFYNNNNSDRNRNIKEWQDVMGMDVSLKDIEFILYKTNPDIFANSFENKTLLKDFDGNSFIKKLSLNKNKDYLEYLHFAKQIEFANYLTTEDPWTDKDFNDDTYIKISSKLLSFCKNKINSTKNEFLKLRYIYQYIRTTTCEESIEYYDNFFDKNPSKSIIKIWALFFKACALDKCDKKIEANYLYSKVFELSDEKKHYCYRALYKDPQSLYKTMLLMNTSVEKGNILSLSILNYPGRTLRKLEEIYKICPRNDFFYLLIMREINKLEDWLYTDDTHDNPYYFTTVKERGKIMDRRTLNHIKDSEYLLQLKEFLISCYYSKKSINKDFLALAISHLSLLANDNEQGQEYLNKISKNANQAILDQKHVEELMYLTNNLNLNKSNVKNKITLQLQYIEKLAEKNIYYYKSLYSLTKRLSSQYNNFKDIAIAGLFDMKAEFYKEKYGNIKTEYPYYDNDLSNSYHFMKYFDENASVGDMDELITLCKKKKKSLFEKYICEHSTSDINLYWDLKGTIAFRKTDLEVAYKAFAEIPDKFWQDSLLFYKSYLNEDPFVPRYIITKRNFTYHFNKAVFVKQLLDLIVDAKKNPKNRAADYLKLGHAYFNCSYFGNSWLMQQYNRSSSEYPPYDYSGYRVHERKKHDLFLYNNYYKNTVAISYYNKAIQSTTNKELKAEASYMMAECNRKYMFQYLTYKNTNFFHNTYCPDVDDFVINVKKRIHV